MIEVNEFQTQLSDDFLSSLKEEVRSDLFDLINNVEFIKRLISKDRPRAKDCKRDNSGKIIVDLSNPHILENMDYFRQAGIHWQKHGVYTKLLPNSNPASEYGQWLKREINRCWNGMVRESDGEWITGDMYFYLNYFPIIQTQLIPGTLIGDRVSDLPEVWEGVYWRFHYWHQAKYGGKYNDFKGGKHCVEIAARGRSKSYSFGSKLAKNFLLGENSATRKGKVKSVINAYQKEYLTKDGTITKFLDGIEHCAKYTQFPSKKLKESNSDMHWVLGFIDKVDGSEKGLKNEVIGLAVKDDTEKGRGKRSSWFGIEEFGAFKGFLDYWQTSIPNVQEGSVLFGQISSIGTGGSEGCLTADNKVFTNSGDLISIKDVTIDTGIIGHNFDSCKCSKEEVEYINTPTYKECVNITTNSFRTIECSLDHPIWSSIKSDYNGNRVFEWVDACKLKIGDKVAISKEVGIFNNKPIFNPRLLGILIGDGSYIGSPTVTTCDKEIQDFLINNFDCSIYGDSTLTKDNKNLVAIGIKKIRDELRSLGIYGQSKNNKRLPRDIFLASKKDVSELIGGLFDTDGSVNIYNSNKGNRLPSTTLNLSSSSVELLKEVQLLLMKLGIYGNIMYHKPSSNQNKKIKDKNGCYSLEISSRDSIIAFKENVNLLIKYKQDLLDKAYNISLSKNRWRKDRGYEYETIKSIKYVGEKIVYNLSAKNTHTYLGNGIITHNSNFMGALEMINHPEGYNVYSLPNIYDKGSSGNKTTIFFFPGYVNVKGYYNKDGVSDVVGSILSELEFRYVLKYNSSDPMQLTRRKAETAFTLQDAIMRRDSSLYPSDKLNDVILNLSLDPKYTDDMWIGKLSMNSIDGVKFVIDRDSKYITEFPHKNNKIEGAVCIKQMPIKDSSGKIPWGRYIGGVDTYDDDTSETMSLFSMFILDMWTDELVFEYTGRPPFAEDAYETCRMAAIMYNAEILYENNKKGLFKHFSQHSSLYLLADSPSFLKDKEDVSFGKINNKTKGVGNYGTVGPYARRCVRDWLMKENKIIKSDVDENGKEVQLIENSLSLYSIWSKALAQELSMWNPDGNFDRHDALCMLMLLREEKYRLNGILTPEEAAKNRDINYLGNDDFFNKNYHSKIKENDIYN